MVVNREVQESVKRKSRAFKDWRVRQAQREEEQYREEEKDSRRKVGIGIGKAIEQLNERLRTKEGEKDIYKISKLKKKQKQDLSQLVVIRDRDGNILHRDDDIKRIWRKYYDQLLNTENEKKEQKEAQRVEGPVVEI
ncbi:trichohyalin-like [Palaemon carinicauda]|uniref:trichohyalin-like n=1 Tax=Palaemon carinicauda TaxID=392227 RepID=UPI0035B639D7